MKYFLILVLASLLTACAQTPETKVSADRQTQFRIAQTSEENGQYRSALNLYQRLYDVQPGDEINLALGRLYYRLGEWLMAQTHLEQVSENGEFHQDANLWLTRTHLRLANPEKALSYIPVSTQSPVWANLQAVALDYLQQHDKAQAIYLSQLKISPLNTEIRRNLVYSYLLAGDYQQAQEQLSTLYELGYRDDRHSMLDAIVTLLQQDSDAALRQLEHFSSPFEIERFAAQLRQLRSQ